MKFMNLEYKNYYDLKVTMKSRNIKKLQVTNIQGHDLMFKIIYSQITFDNGF